VSARLGQKKLELLPGFFVTVGLHLDERKEAFPTVKGCPPALFVFDPTLAKPATANKLELFASGPYSQRGFSPSKPKICVVCQRARKGEVEQVPAEILRRGHRSGAKMLFRERFQQDLPSFGLRSTVLSGDDASAGAYRKAVQDALQAVESEDQRWNLALVQVDESSHGPAR